MKSAVFVVAALVCLPVLHAQDETFRLTVLGYQWTNNHRTITFTWPGYANSSCNGSANVNGYISNSGTFSATGTESSTCSTTYTPPSTQSIEISKPVVYILADTDTSRMVLTCTRNVRWSQCHALNPGGFRARVDRGHFEVQGLSGKGKEEWVRFDVVQQIGISGQTKVASTAEAAASIESPKVEGSSANGGFPSRWKSMTTGNVRTLRFEGDYVYGELIVSESAAKAGAFSLMDVKKNGDKFIGKINARVVS